jgi:hypothetical protein
MVDGLSIESDLFRLLGYDCRQLNFEKVTQGFFGASRQCKPFQSNENFPSFSKPGSSLTSIPEFVIGSHSAYWSTALVGVGCG